MCYKTSFLPWNCSVTNTVRVSYVTDLSNQSRQRLGVATYRLLNSKSLLTIHRSHPQDLRQKLVKRPSPIRWQDLYARICGPLALFQGKVFRIMTELEPRVKTPSHTTIIEAPRLVFLGARHLFHAQISLSVFSLLRESQSCLVAAGCIDRSV